MAINARDEQIVRQTILNTTAKARDQQIFRQTVFTRTGTGNATQLMSWTDPAFGFKRVTKRNHGLYQLASIPVFPVTPKMFPIIFCVT